MANMSYCRFHNTFEDLRDCYDHIDDDDLSDEENKARKRLVEICKKIAADFEDEEND